MFILDMRLKIPLLLRNMKVLELNEIRIIVMMLEFLSYHAAYYFTV